MALIVGHEAFIYCDSLPYSSKKIDIGIVKEISDPYESKLSETKIMGLPSERKIVMDKSVSNTKTLTYKRKSPNVPQDDYTVDSTKWSNGFWMFNVQRYLVNRFQMETDGCKITFIVRNEDGNASELYSNISGQNCYISGFGFGYNQGNPFELSGTITLKTGSCKGSKQGMYTITYHSNFASVTDKITTEASYMQIYYSEKPSVDEYPMSWRQILEKAGVPITPSDRSKWWWCPYTDMDFDTACNTGNTEMNRAFRWENEEEGWKDLPQYITDVQMDAEDIVLYAIYDGFHKKWEDERC